MEIEAFKKKILETPSYKYFDSVDKKFDRTQLNTFEGLMIKGITIPTALYLSKIERKYLDEFIGVTPEWEDRMSILGDFNANLAELHVHNELEMGNLIAVSRYIDNKTEKKAYIQQVFKTDRVLDSSETREKLKYKGYMIPGKESKPE